MIHLCASSLPTERSLLLPKDRDPRQVLETVAKSLRKPNLLINDRLEVIERNWRWRFDTLSERIAHPCKANDSLESFRIPRVANAVLQFCKEHSKKINNTPGLCRTIFQDILVPLEARGKEKYTQEMVQLKDRAVTLMSQLARPTDKTAFPDSTALGICLDWISQAILHPKKYQLQSSSNDQTILLLKDLNTNTSRETKLPFSLDIVYKNNRLVHCILISQRPCHKGSFSSPPICWDVLFGQSLVLKSREIEETARPIIEHIAKERFPETVPILVLNNPWRIYEKDCGQDLFHILNRCTLDDTQKLACAKGLLKMLANFHGRTYLIDQQEIPAFHGDIKPSNILDNDGLVFTDFGSTSLELLSGTLDYMSPQTIQVLENLKQRIHQSEDWRIEFNPYRQAHDVWSMGVTLFQILKNRYTKLPLLFTKEELASMSQDALDAKLKNEKPRLLSKTLEPVWLCIEQMLRVNPNERISAKEAYEKLKVTQESVFSKVEN